MLSASSRLVVGLQYTSDESHRGTLAISTCSLQVARVVDGSETSSSEASHSGSGSHVQLLNTNMLNRTHKLIIHAPNRKPSNMTCRLHSLKGRRARKASPTRPANLPVLKEKPSAPSIDVVSSMLPACRSGSRLPENVRFPHTS